MKEITHEEVKRDVNIIKLLNIPQAYLSKKRLERLDNYITQQQAKEERAKKVDELLDLYRELNAQVEIWYKCDEVVIHERIKTLEEELK